MFPLDVKLNQEAAGVTHRATTSVIGESYVAGKSRRLICRTGERPRGYRHRGERIAHMNELLIALSDAGASRRSLWRLAAFTHGYAHHGRQYQKIRGRARERASPKGGTIL